MTDKAESSPNGAKKPRFSKGIKIAGGIIVAALIIFLGIKFIPGFFNGGKPHSSEASESSTKTADSTPTATTAGDKTEFTVRSASLLGQDTALESAHFVIYCHKADQTKAESLISISEKDYLALAKYFSNTPKTEILLTYDSDEYVTTFTAAPPWGAESYKDPSSSAGAFCPGCTKSLGDKTEYIYMLRPGNRSFSHELAHRYFWSSYPKLSKNNSLTWLNEGQAVFIQTEVAPGPGGLSGDVNKINGSALPSSFAELNQLQQKSDGDSLVRFYNLVGLLAYYIDSRTNGGIKSFLTDLNSTQNIDQTCKNKLGFNSSQLFANWKEVLSRTSGNTSEDFLTNYKTLIKQ